MMHFSFFFYIHEFEYISISTSFVCRPKWMIIITAIYKKVIKDTKQINSGISILLYWFYYLHWRDVKFLGPHHTVNFGHRLANGRYSHSIWVPIQWYATRLIFHSIIQIGSITTHILYTVASVSTHSIHDILLRPSKWMESYYYIVCMRNNERCLSL